MLAVFPAHELAVLEIKRALLTFDKVYLADPDDRELFPPQAFMTAIGMPPIMGISVGPVRPIGKLPGYKPRWTVRAGIEELTRPVDAIKHQAKTVTVGISRSDETRAVLFVAVVFIMVRGSRVVQKTSGYQLARACVICRP